MWLQFLLALSVTVRMSTETVIISAENAELFENDFLSTQILPGMLYPRESESREVKSLDGFWRFYADSNYQHFDIQNFSFIKNLSKFRTEMLMPVPSSYNDITASKSLRDYVGPVFYYRHFYAPSSWKGKRVFLRFGSVNYLAIVFTDPTTDVITMRHEIGHLPFESEIKVHYGQRNLVIVMVYNILTQISVPQGKVVEEKSDNGTVKLQTYTFDFFNYAGIHRPVLLHTKPKVFVEDIDIDVELTVDTATIHYSIKIGGLDDEDKPTCSVNLFDADEKAAIDKPIEGSDGSMMVKSPRLWWPRSMSAEPGYMYTLEVTVSAPSSPEPDVYRLPVGLRTLRWNDTALLINERPIYFRGFGRHEDSDIRGRGLDLVTVARDHELLMWVGANAYRTSHYPYSDEVLDEADRLGFLIIGECPSVNTDNFTAELLENHKQSISELIRRDKNRPSVIMWSIANEPRTHTKLAGVYFKEVAQHTKALDPTRPITIAMFTTVEEDKVGQYLDIISFNRYNAWYVNPGRLDMITNRVISEAQAWHDKYKKPVMMTEYGADTMTGLHELPEYIWSEEYQVELMSRHFLAFDRLRAKGFFIGEFIWNFADFRTAQTIQRVAGNKKGIFTRNRQPKMAAYHVRRRYQALSKELDGEAEIPEDLENYISINGCHQTRASYQDWLN